MTRVIIPLEPAMCEFANSPVSLLTLTTRTAQYIAKVSIMLNRTYTACVSDYSFIPHKQEIGELTHAYCVNNTWQQQVWNVLYDIDICENCECQETTVITNLQTAINDILELIPDTHRHGSGELIAMFISANAWHLPVSVSARIEFMLQRYIMQYGNKQTYSTMLQVLERTRHICWNYMPYKQTAINGKWQTII